MPKWQIIYDITYNNIYFLLTNFLICLLYTSKMCIRDREYSRPIVFGEDRLRERGSLPATFNVLTWVIVSLTNDNCRTFKQNQIMFCMHPWLVEDSRRVHFGEDQLRGRGSLLATFYVITRLILFMTNDNCRTLKQNQLLFRIPFWIIQNSRSVDFVEDRLRELSLIHI